MLACVFPMAVFTRSSAGEVTEIGPRHLHLYIHVPACHIYNSDDDFMCICSRDIHTVLAAYGR